MNTKELWWVEACMRPTESYELKGHWAYIPSHTLQRPYEGGHVSSC